MSTRVYIALMFSGWRKTISKLRRKKRSIAIKRLENFHNFNIVRIGKATPWLISKLSILKLIGQMNVDEQTKPIESDARTYDPIKINSVN